MTKETISNFVQYLRIEERSAGTIDKYLRDVHAFAAWLGEKPVTKESAAEWKEHLLANHHAPVTVNSMLAAVNCFFRFQGWEDCRVKFLKLQRRLFRDSCRELNRAEYERLVETAAS